MATPPRNAHRVVLDPGALVSVLLSPRGAPARLYPPWLSGAFELIVCPHLLEELEAVRRRPKFRDAVTLEEAAEFVEGIGRSAMTFENPLITEGMLRDPDDDLVALARAAGADYLVSGDKDLASPATMSPPVLSPAAFLRLL